jgi:RimJ/RimL family protein N-acetyltransferase
MEPIQTERLTLRRFRPEDCRDLHEMIVPYQASEYSRYDHRWPTSKPETQGVARRFSEGDRYLAVCLRTAGKLIGLVALNPENREDGPAFNLGYVFNFDYHGQGYATEACRAAIEHAFDQLGTATIVTGTAAANLPSHRLLARLGFREIGNGMYELPCDEWLSRRRVMERREGPSASG